MTCDPRTARLEAPRTSLASCIRATLIRDTTMIPPLPPEQRLNYFAGTHLCSLTIFVQGVGIPIPFGDRPTRAPEGVPVAKAVIGGPMTGPSASVNPGPVHAVMMMFFPQALHALTGLDLSAHTDRLVPVADALPPEWQAMCDAAIAAPDDTARLALIEDFLEPRWHAARATGRAGSHAVSDWANSVALQMATSGWARSVRQLERRIKTMTGQSLRSLHRFDRADERFAQNRQAYDAGERSLAALAAQSGYADQSHMSREARAITGFTPSEIMDRALNDERFWTYRVWT